MATKKSTKNEKLGDVVRDKIAEQKYYRDPEHGMIAGVLAGFANYSGWDLFVLRLLVVIFAVCTAIFPFVIAYLVIWLIAPVQDGKSKPAKATTTQSLSAEGSVSSGARVILCVLGVLGLIALLPALIILIPVSVFSLIAVFTNDIPEKALFVTTVILGIILAINVLAIGISICGAMVAAKFKRSTGISLIVNLIIALIIFTSACVTGGLWYTRVGRSGARQTLNQITDGYEVEIDDDGSRIEIHRGGKKQLIIESGDV